MSLDDFSLSHRYELNGLTMGIELFILSLFTCNKGLSRVK